MERKNLYIDFDGVILDTIKPLYDDYKAQNIEKEKAKEFYINYPWKNIINDKYIINDSNDKTAVTGPNKNEAVEYIIDINAKDIKSIRKSIRNE